MWIEIFRTGRHTDSAGNSEYYTPEMLDEIAAIYNKRVSDSDNSAAPVVIGHPADDSPARGWIERLARRGDRLMASLTDLDAELLDRIKSGEFRNVSMAISADKSLRHIGFLGGAAPAVEGLRSGEFNASGDYERFVVGNDNDEPDEDERHAALEADNRRLRETIDAMQRESRTREFRDYVNNLIEAPGGSVILPAQAEAIVELMEIIHRADSANDEGNLDKFRSLLDSLTPRVPAGEFALNPGQMELFPDYGFDSKNVRPERLDLHSRAMKLTRETPGLTYEEAVLIARAEA
ncbi:MAG: hypothetical protein ACLFQX_01975 [Candidatus Kapaibacterium sp.]